jgi:hypothetical protein
VDTFDEGSQLRQGAPGAALSTLEDSIVEEIEDLHRQAMSNRAAGRFGFLPASATAQIKAAEAAEEALLAGHGFSSYADFHRRTSGSKARADSPDSQAVAVLDPGCSDAPAPPSAEPPPDPDGGDRLESLLARLQARADQLVEDLTEELERRFALILERASDDFAEITRRLTEGRDAVAALFAPSSCPPEHPEVAGPGGPVAKGDACQDTTALRRELGELSRGETATND